MSHFFGGEGGISFLRKSRLAALTVHRTVIHYRSLQIPSDKSAKTKTAKKAVLTLAEKEGFEPSRQFPDLHP